MEMSFIDYAIKLRQFDANEIFCNKTNNILGEGRFGKVLIGFHDVLGTVAVKYRFLPQSLNERKETQKKLEKEMSLMHEAHHNNVIRIEGVLKCQGWLGIVMELMPAGSLHDLIRNENVSSIPMSLLLRMGYEVSDGITYLHNLMKNQRIAHGDLKPQNILLTLDLNCKIADFGGVCRTGSLKPDPDKPGEGLESTLLFAAPERLADGCDSLTTAMDVYSFGVLLLVAITQKYPSRGTNFANPQQDVPQISFDKASLQQMKDAAADSGDEQDVEMFSLLEDIMTKCVSILPEIRPALIDVRDQLQGMLKEVEDAEIAEHVADILSHLKIRKFIRDLENSEAIGTQLFDGSGRKPTITRKGASRNKSRGKGPGDANKTNGEESSLSPGSMKDLKPALSRRGASRRKSAILEEEKLGLPGFISKLHSIQKRFSEQNLDGALQEIEDLSKSLQTSYLNEADAVKLKDALIQAMKSGVKDKISSEKFADCFQALLCVADYLAKSISSPIQKLNLLGNCASVANEFVLAVKDQVNLNYILESMKTSFTRIQSTKFADRKVLAEAKAACWQCQSQCYIELGETGHAMELLLSAVTAIENAFKFDCKKPSLYGSCCNNLAIIYKSKDKPKQALKFYMNDIRLVTQDQASNDVLVTIRNVCQLFEDYSSMDRDSDDLNYLHDFLQHHENQPSSHWEVPRKLLRLRVEILLQSDKIKKSCEETISAMSMPSLSDQQLIFVCEEAGNVSEQLLLIGEKDLALSMVRCGGEASQHLSKSARKLKIIVQFCQVLLDCFSEPGSKLCKKPDEIIAQYRPLLDELSSYVNDESCNFNDVKITFRSLRSILFYQMIKDSQTKGKKFCLIV
ncbi:uncharacterized protein LOC143448618 [Clavelina lepadiformis]|uniref:uncharacterized protein LOC143448618 n=1 Tax=Clavelina lepadiformis TaxID=159417 RepID=UPI00404345C6